MPDLVVTVPRKLWLEWIDEGDAVGEPESGEEWGFFLGWQRPPIAPGERLYVVAHDRLRGYAPVTRVAYFLDGCPDHSALAAELTEGIAGRDAVDCAWCRAWLGQESFGLPERPNIGRKVTGRWAVGRRGGAVAVTIGALWQQGHRPGQDDQLANIRGFRGFRKRWWPREVEAPFPDWKSRDLWLNRAARRKPGSANAEQGSESTTRQGSLFDG